MVELPTQSGRARTVTGFASSVFVGRQREMGVLMDALEDALSGQGHLVMLVGEPGIGKTRTAQALASRAETRGAQVLWGRCYEDQGAPPYWPWVQAIRSYVRERDPTQWHAEMGAGAADIAEVVSDVRELLPDLKPPPALEPEQARFRLFDSIAAFLKSAGRRQPLVLILDDLQWADKSSLLLLQFMARELGQGRLLLLGTYQDVELSRQHPLAETLGKLTREPVFQRVLLRGFGQQDVARFIQVAAGTTPPQGLVEAVYTQTQGNPLFVTEVARLLAQEGELTAGPLSRETTGIIRIPEGVREVIGLRLNRLSQGCNQVLTVASVVGRHFALDLLERLIHDQTRDQLLGLLEEAVRARVIEENQIGRYQFTHALVRETLMQELTLTRRVELHARIGEALEGLYGPEAPEHADELAHHFAQAVTISGAQKLVQYSLLAGERALEHYAHEEALGHFQRGLAAKEGQPASGDSEEESARDTADLLFGLGRAQAAIAERHQLREAVDNLRRAFNYYVQAGDLDKAVEVAEYPVPSQVGHPMGMAALIAQALERVEPDSLRAGRLQCRYCMVLGIEEGEYAKAQRAFARARAIARQKRNPALEARCLANSARVDYFHLRHPQSLRKSQRAIKLASQVGDLQTLVSANYYAANSRKYLGDLEEVRRHTEAMLEPAERLRDRDLRVIAFWSNQQLACLEGKWENARDFGGRGLAVAPLDPRLLGNKIVQEYEVGNFDQGTEYLDRLLGVLRRTPSGPTLEHTFAALVIPLVARITGSSGKLNVAEAAAKTILSSPSAAPTHATYARVGLALLAVQRGNLAAARQSYDALASRRGSMIRMIASDRLLGLLAQTMGDFAKATGHFEDALAFCRNAGYRPELAWTCCDYADALLERNGPGYRVRAMGLLEEAVEIARELGMRPLEERARAFQELAQAQQGQAPRYPDGLSQREVDVLRLMAQGRSNQQIADELFISLRTVANHVTSILNKTNTSNRTEAAAYAIRHGLG